MLVLLFVYLLFSRLCFVALIPLLSVIVRVLSRLTSPYYSRHVSDRFPDITLLCRQADAVLALPLSVPPVLLLFVVHVIANVHQRQMYVGACCHDYVVSLRRHGATPEDDGDIRLKQLN